MTIPKPLRQQVYDKFNGLCAYTGKSLGEKWQVDHITPKEHYLWWQPEVTRHKLGFFMEDPNDINNLFPSLPIINHYKRYRTLEDFREYMLTFHIRLAKLPKSPRVQKSINRKKYMWDVATAFGITTDIPFDGKFYFEKLNNPM